MQRVVLQLSQHSSFICDKGDVEYFTYESLNCKLLTHFLVSNAFTLFEIHFLVSQPTFIQDPFTR